MKVLLVHNFYKGTQIGGEDLVFRAEEKALKEQIGDKNVFVYTVSNDNLKFITLLFGIWHNLYHYHKIAHIIKQNNIDIVHVHNFFPMLTPSIFKAAKKNGARVFHTLHNFRIWCLAGTLFCKNNYCEKCVNYKFALNGVKNKCYRGSFIQSLVAAMAFWFYKLINSFKYIDYYIVISNTQKQILNKFPFINKEKIILKPNIIDVGNVKVEPSIKQDYVYVGRAEKGKGIWELLDVWSKLDKSYKLNIIGKGEDYSILKSKYTRENIKFLGNLPFNKVTEIVAKSKYLIHPGLMVETFGLVILEAFACGTPVIGFDIGTRKEFIKNGENGFLTNKQDLAKIIKQADIYAQYSKLCDNALKTASKFAKQRIIAQQIKLYSV